MEERYCEWCGEKITKKNAKRFCCREHYNLFRKTEYYNKYLEDNSIAYGQKNMQHYKKFFLEEQNYKCAICGMLNEWNGKELIFVLDHKDGHANNNNRENLRLICPNCDSQLETYKSKNPKSDRTYR